MCAPFRSDSTHSEYALPLEAARIGSFADSTPTVAHGASMPAAFLHRRQKIAKAGNVAMRNVDQGPACAKTHITGSATRGVMEEECRSGGLARQRADANVWDLAQPLLQHHAGVLGVLHLHRPADCWRVPPCLQWCATRIPCVCRNVKFAGMLDHTMCFRHVAIWCTCGDLTRRPVRFSTQPVPLDAAADEDLPVLMPRNAVRPARRKLQDAS